MSDKVAIAEKIAVGLIKLPSLPTVLMDALGHLDNRKSSTAEIIDKIGQDPPLTARILRIANSPFFGLPRQIASLREAVILMGVDRVRELLISACFPRLFPIIDGPFDPTRFWNHSMTVAVCARWIACHADINPESAFTVGLLHDIGRLVLGHLFPKEFSRVMDGRLGGGLDMLEAERRIFGIDHATLGAEVAHRWNFPQAIQEAIARHHAVPVIGSAKSLVTVVYVANLIGAEWATRETAPFPWSEEVRFALDLLEVPGEAMQALPGTVRGIANQANLIL